MTVFSPDWFEHHQGKLLWLCNHWLTRRWFRWVLRIRKSDIGHRRRIIELRPHCYTVALGQNADGDSLLATDFRTHPKFAKRIYHAFLPLWRLCHLWDFAADAFAPRISFGFLTLTVYPDASSGATTVDGIAYRSVASETFATIQGGAGTGFSTTVAYCQMEVLASTTTNQFQTLVRSIMTFNTAQIGLLGTDVSILSATLSLFGGAKANALGGSPDVHIAGATPASNNDVVAADYSQCGTTSFGSVVYASISTSGYNNIVMNDSGLANINVSGISKFSGRLSWDINNSFTGVWASNGDAIVQMNSKDSGLGDPKLTVVYSLKNHFTNQTNNLRPGLFRPQIAR